ncbi:Aspartic proteinase [Mycena indigotica]|uniref:Aspartic proteinase n=1 Tax=Mycena indigotica TaxID=2126181 RepID=A0A8H6WA16_9AGAR|nr:Aspartic proteinase [Mycena indigotica]KAF7307218.1 Aspartic proteinase [Mycena indigotica]
MLVFTLLPAVLLALRVAASPVLVQDNLITLPISRRFNFTGSANIVQADLGRIKSIRTGKAAGAQARAVISEPISNQVVTYIASVGVGSPATTYDLIVDTGSSNTWIGAGTSYVRTPTSTQTINTVSVSYGSGSFSGTEYTDTVTLAPGLVIPNQSIGVASRSSGFSGTDGILGLGPVALTVGTLTNARTQSVPTVTDNLFTQGTINANSIGISFQPTTSLEVTNGEITFGGTDPSRFTGSITFTPITSTSPASLYWGINQSITYGGTTILSSTAGIVDTGTTLIYIATNAFTAYQRATGAVADNNTGLLRLTSSQFAALKNLNFVIGGTTFALTPNAQIWPRQVQISLDRSNAKPYLAPLTLPLVARPAASTSLSPTGVLPQARVWTSSMAMPSSSASTLSTTLPTSASVLRPLPSPPRPQTELYPEGFESWDVFYTVFVLPLGQGLPTRSFYPPARSIVLSALGSFEYITSADLPIRLDDDPPKLKPVELVFPPQPPPRRSKLARFLLRLVTRRPRSSPSYQVSISPLDSGKASSQTPTQSSAPVVYIRVEPRELTDSTTSSLLETPTETRIIDKFPLPPSVHFSTEDKENQPFHPYQHLQPLSDRSASAATPLSPSTNLPPNLVPFPSYSNSNDSSTNYQHQQPRFTMDYTGKQGAEVIDFGGEVDYSNTQWFQDRPAKQPSAQAMGAPYVPPPGVIEQNESFEFAMSAAPNVLYARYKQYGQLGVLAWCSEFGELIDHLKELGFQGNMFVTTRTQALRTCEEILRLMKHSLDLKMQIIIMYLSSQVARLRRFLDGERQWDDYPEPQFPDYKKYVNGEFA